MSMGVTGMRVTCSEFADGESIPRRYTCDGDDISPPLSFHDVPAETRSLALIMEDPDAPRGTWDHWLLYDIPVGDGIPAGASPGMVGTVGVNSWGRSDYGGPCPPGGQHRYVIAVYAVDTELGLPRGVDKPTLQDALAGHTLADATLTGVYARP